MSERRSRLEAALAVWLEFQARGGDRDELLAAHPDLRELLRAFMTEDGAPGAEPMPAQVLGDYRLLRELGRGGMAVVFAARQITLDRPVAIKVLAPALAARPASLARFRREALHLARLDHPGILRVFDVGEQDGQHWLAMELVDGESLDRRLDALRQQGGHRGDSLRALLLAVEQVARALHHAHQHGVVHRDVKPSNILLRKDGSAVLGDFGLARDDEDPTLTQVGAVAGTPHYLSPEQVLSRRAEVDARSDVFALGVTLYECSTLQLPFAGTTIEQILHRIVHRDPVDPRRLHAGLPADLAAIIEHALEKEPVRRYQSAGALADDLRAFLELRPVQVRPLSRLARARRWARREPLRAALVATGALVLLLAGFLALQWPAIRAAADERRRVAYEHEITAGILARTGKDPGVAYRHFHRALALAPGRGEAIAGLCLAIRHFEGAPAALAELERRSGTSSADEDVERMRALLLRRLDRGAEAESLERRLGAPRSATAMWLTAATMLEDQEDTAALRQARQLMSLVTRIAPEPRLLYHVQWAVLESTVGDEATRRESAQALLQLWPDSPLALYQAALNLRLSEPAQAIDRFRQALALGLDDPLGRVNLAMTLQRVGRLSEAAAEAHRALTEVDRHDVTLGRLGDQARVLMLRLLHEVGDPGLGAACERWLEAAPDNASALRMMAQYAHRHGDPERGVALLRRAQELAPANREVACDLALVLLDSGDAEAAVATLQPVVAAHPTFQHAHDLLLDALHELGQSGLAELQRWTDANPLDVRAWTELAAALLDQPGPDHARRALDAAERADYLGQGKDPELLQLRARALDRLGRGDEARHLREKADGMAAARARGG